MEKEIQEAYDFARKASSQSFRENGRLGASPFGLDEIPFSKFKNARFEIQLPQSIILIS